VEALVANNQMALAMIVRNFECTVVCDKRMRRTEDVWGLDLKSNKSRVSYDKSANSNAKMGKQKPTKSLDITRQSSDGVL
jgi:hypothetical protein